MRRRRSRPAACCRWTSSRAPRPATRRPPATRISAAGPGPTPLSNTEYSEYYESTQFKIPTPDFETQAVGVKLLGYWGVGDNNQPAAPGSGPTELYSVMRGNGVGTSIMTS